MTTPVSESPADAARALASRGRRAFWLKQMHQWHWISAAISMIGLLLFAITGITLNHAGQIPANPKVVERKATLPPAQLAALAKGPADGKAPVPVVVADWLGQHAKVNVAGKDGEWSPEEVYVALPRPGGDGWVTLDRETGAVVNETTTRGWIAYLNDLHKGRNTGGAWMWFIDIFAAACIVFTVTGFFLLQLHAKQRAATWPLVGLGVLIPLLLALLFIH